MNDFVINGAPINGSVGASSVAHTLSLTTAAVVVACPSIALNSTRRLSISPAAITINFPAVSLIVTRAGLLPYVPSVIKCKVTRLAGEPDPRRTLVKAL